MTISARTRQQTRTDELPQARLRAIDDCRQERDERDGDPREESGLGRGHGAQGEGLEGEAEEGEKPHEDAGGGLRRGKGEELAGRDAVTGGRYRLRGGSGEGRGGARWARLVVSLVASFAQKAPRLAKMPRGACGRALQVVTDVAQR